MVAGQPVTAQQLRVDTITQRIDNLPHRLNGGRYAAEDGTAVFSCFIDAPRRLRFGRIRRSNLPALVDGPNISNIRVAPGGGIFECSHVVFFPNGILGADFNFYSPRIARLAGYMSAKAAAPQELEFLPIARRDPAEIFESFDIVKAFEMKLATSLLPEIRQTGLIANMVANARDAGIAIIDVKLSSERGRLNESIPAVVIRNIKSFLSVENVREKVIKVAASGYLPNVTKLDTLDLLADEVVASKTFIRESARGKELDKDHAFQTIEAAYREVRPDRFLQ